MQLTYRGIPYQKSELPTQEPSSETVYTYRSVTYQYKPKNLLRTDALKPAIFSYRGVKYTTKIKGYRETSQSYLSETI
ncbi:DUF4278 domain-containing protein [Capilliphycus salinus ALCB114379]|uniref:DUF4278 domain-containing protein n=1 Tax=Capilliphycus salinus TaxID=2768948 RepID=UPI0039A5457A